MPIALASTPGGCDQEGCWSGGAVADRDQFRSLYTGIPSGSRFIRSSAWLSVGTWPPGTRSSPAALACCCHEIALRRPFPLPAPPLLSLHLSRPVHVDIGELWRQWRPSVTYNHTREQIAALQEDSDAWLARMANEPPTVSQALGLTAPPPRSLAA